MDDLAAFIEARLADDEAAARESHHEGQRWITEEEGVYRWPDDELVHSADRKADARHIARHDPARVLREVTAKRARLAYYLDAQAKLDHIIAHPGEMSPGDQGMWLGKTAAARMACRHDAAVWSDHPDYRAEWAPAL